MQISRASLNLFTRSRVLRLHNVPLLREPWRYYFHHRSYIRYFSRKTSRFRYTKIKKWDGFYFPFIFRSFEWTLSNQLRQIAYLLQFHYTWNGLLRFSRVSAVPLARVFHYLIMFCQALCHFSATSHELRWIYNQTSDHKVYEWNKRWCIPCLASKVAELILKTITRNFCIELLIKIITRNYKLQLLESLICHLVIKYRINLFFNSFADFLVASKIFMQLEILFFSLEKFVLQRWQIEIFYLYNLE